MPYSVAGQADHSPSRPHPRDAPRRGELTAVIALALVLAHLLLAQLTLVLMAAMWAVDRVSRWRPQWLAAPAGAGLLWTLAIGPARAAAGLGNGPRQVLGYLAGIDRYPGRLLHLADAFDRLPRWLPGQFPLALILASAEVLALTWLQRRLDGGRAWRSGLIVAGRRRATTVTLRSGGVVSRDGCRVGVDLATGRPAEISWAEAEGGVLWSGAGSAAELTERAFPVAHAAIRRRKPVIVVDLTGSPWLAGSLAAACAESGAPYARFGPDGPGCYEPMRGGDPARASALVMSMIDWTGATDQQRRSCAAYLTDALAVQAAAPRDRRLPLLDDLVRLLTPDGLRERAALIPAYHPRREVLADRVGVSAALLQADPAIVAAPAAQLATLLGSASGHWLQPGPPDGPRVSLGQTVRDRGAVLFSLDGRAAPMIAGLVVTDLSGVCAELDAMSVHGDGLAWINGCEVLGQRALADLAGLVAQGRGAGMGMVLATTSRAVADGLAAAVNVVVGAAQPPQGPDGFALWARAPSERMLPRCRPVAAAAGTGRTPGHTLGQVP
jgi:hypothetical protein